MVKLWIIYCHSSGCTTSKCIENKQQQTIYIFVTACPTEGLQCRVFKEQSFLSKKTKLRSKSQNSTSNVLWPQGPQKYVENSLKSTNFSQDRYEVRIVGKDQPKTKPTSSATLALVTPYKANAKVFLNNIPASRQVCTAVDFSYSALRHALGPRDVRSFYRARATKDRKTSLVASCTWKQTVVLLTLLVWKKKFLLFSGYSSHTKELHQSFFLRVRIFIFYFFLWNHWQVVEKLRRNYLLNNR